MELGKLVAEKKMDSTIAGFSGDCYINRRMEYTSYLNLHCLSTAHMLLKGVVPKLIEYMQQQTKATHPT